MDSQAIATFIAAGTGIVSAGLLTWQTIILWRNTKRAPPHFEISRTRLAGHTGWERVTITVRNTQTTEVRLEGVALKSPKRGSIILERDTLIPDNHGGKKVPEALPIDRTARSVKIGLTAAPSGTPKSTFTWGDTAYTTILGYELSPKPITIALHWRWCDHQNSLRTSKYTTTSRLND
ncbi:hypothetical protein [Albibacillus kandeliae]|uniref:hypothetical protein n=1 Tax=Albibacillus kandeliae TaxID=2174228 RepID=UPI0013007AA5|nr:hypothetical protein [Albibacillus kandeliae]